MSLFMNTYQSTSTKEPMGLIVSWGDFALICIVYICETTAWPELCLDIANVDMYEVLLAHLVVRFNFVYTDDIFWFRC